MNRYIIYFLINIILLPLFGEFSDAQFSKRIATLDWNINTESDLAGYKVYRGIGSCSGNPTMVAIITLGTVNTFIDDKIPADANFVCYAVTAYDTEGNESTFSNKADKVINFAPAAPSKPIFK